MKNEDMTFSELYKTWFAEKSQDVGETTRKVYRSYLNKYIPDDIGRRIVNDIDRDEWLEMEKEMMGGKAPNGLPIPKTTARLAISVYHAVFKYGNNEFSLINPLEGETVSAKDMYSITVFTKSEIRKMRDHVKAFDIFHLALMLCLYTGLEVGEICAVQWGDIDTENKLIKIRRVLYKANIIREPKSVKIMRDLPIPTWINEQLELMKPMHPDDEYILTGPNGYIHHTTFRSKYTAFLKNAGVDYRIVNAMRHTFAMTCIEKNMDIKTLSEMLGHSNTTVTLRMYYKDQGKNKRKIIDSLYD